MLILNPETRPTPPPLTRPEPRLGERAAAAARIALATAAAAGAGLAGYAVTQYLGNAWPAWSVLAAVAGFVYLASLNAVTGSGYRWQVPLAVLWGAIFALALPWRAGTEAFAIAGIVAVAGIAAHATYAVAVASYTTLHTFTVLRTYASALASGVVVALVVLYGAAISRGSALLPQGMLARVADDAARFVPTLLPALGQRNATSPLSVQDLARASVQEQLRNDPRFQELSPAQQEAALATAAKQAAASFTRQLGVASASPEASVGSVAQNAVTRLVSGFHDRYGWYFTAAWLLGAFFVARSAAFLMTLAIAGLAWATVTVAVAVGLLRVETVPASRERLVL